jgi:hypothetical protein
MTPPANLSQTVATCCHQGNARSSDQITAKAASIRKSQRVILQKPALVPAGKAVGVRTDGSQGLDRMKP